MQQGRHGRNPVLRTLSVSEVLLAGNVLLLLLLALYLCLFTANGSVRGLVSSSNQNTANSDVTSSHESVSVADWTPSHVAEWMQRISLQRYTELFTAQNVNGEALLQLDTSKMKVSLCLL